MAGDCSRASHLHPGCHHLHSSCAPQEAQAPTVQSTNALLVALFTEASLSEYANFFLDRVLTLYGSPIPLDASFEVKFGGLVTLRQKILLDALKIDVDVTTDLNEARNSFLESVHKAWPVPPSECRKRAIITDFQKATSSKTLESVTCACCGASVLASLCRSIPLHKVNIALLQSSPRSSPASDMPLPMAGHPTLSEYLLCPRGVCEYPSGIILLLCHDCDDSLSKERLPKYALANSLYLGPVPPELQGLTPVEESIIARCRARCLVVQLGFDSEDRDPNNPDTSSKSHYHQRAIKGNVVVFPQHPEFLSNVMPPPVQDIVDHVCIVFVGSKLPEPDWFLKKAHPLLVRRDRVHAALRWLKMNNCLYSNLIIDSHNLSQLPNDGSLLPYTYELVTEDSRRDVTTSRYDSTQPAPFDPSAPLNGEIPLPSVVVTGVGSEATSAELRQAAVNHMKKRRRPFVAAPHDAVFASEFDNPALFPSLYPTLFPYGIGGFDDRSRSVSVSFKTHVRHLLSLSDTRFQFHSSFLFTAFNIMQRRTMLVSVALKTKRSWFRPVAERLNTVTADAAGSIAERLEADSDYVVPSNADPDSANVSFLLQEVNSVTRTVCGTSSSQVIRRNELRAMNMSLGVFPAFITLNPSDTHNPLVKFLYGGDIDIDHLLPDQVPSVHEQSLLVAKNPFVAAKFFDIYVRAFIENILAYDKPSLSNFVPGSKNREGVLGVTKGYYGCVEAQGRGTLHLHIVVWIEGSINPNILRKRFLEECGTTFFKAFASYVEDCISSSVPPPVPSGVDITVPSDSHHPCSVRGVNFAVPELSTPSHQQQDLHNIVKATQIHSHRKTCFKYWKGPPAPQECRFMLGPSATVPVSFVDPVSGEFTLRHADGNVCFFNDTIIQAMHNNMDIKYVASGESAKAIIFYVTDYVTKTQLKMHVSHAALAGALAKLEAREAEDVHEPDADPRVRAKRVLQKCAYEMISKQELSAPQVAANLMGYGDHYSSHKFRCLYWTAAECYVEECIPLDVSGQEDCIDNIVTADGAFGHGPAVEREGPRDVEQDEPHTRLPRHHVDLVDDDVILELDEDGEIAPRASQLRDYVYRGMLFSSVSFWEHVARSSKINVTKRTSAYGLDAEAVQEQQKLWMDCGYDVLSAPSVSRPVSHFLPDHDEHMRSYSMLCHPLDAYIPVPVGPALPRRDRPALREKYCRAMLILFKPWRRPGDLIGQYATWEAAFEQFKQTPEYTPRINEILDNMQVFHECRDSRDDHFRNRRLRLAGFGSEFQSRSAVQLEDGGDGDEGVDDEEAVFLDYLLHTSGPQVNGDVDQCLQTASQAGIISAPNMTIYCAKLDQIATSTSASCHVDISRSGDLLERTWKHAYNLRRLTFRSKPTERVASSRDQRATDDQFSDTDSEADWTCPLPPVIQVPTIVVPDPILHDHDSMLAEVAARWTLNSKQLLAVRILGAQMHN